MRANLNLDTDAYIFASAYANARGLPLGAAVSELLRQREQIPQQALPSRLKMSEHGYWLLPKSGRIVTPEMVKEESEDDPE